jgi:hypothetical protein
MSNGVGGVETRRRGLLAVHSSPCPAGYLTAQHEARGALQRRASRPQELERQNLPAEACCSKPAPADALHVQVDSLFPLGQEGCCSETS